MEDKTRDQLKAMQKAAAQAGQTPIPMVSSDERTTTSSQNVYDSIDSDE